MNDCVFDVAFDDHAIALCDERFPHDSFVSVLILSVRLLSVKADFRQVNLHDCMFWNKGTMYLEAGCAIGMVSSCCILDDRFTFYRL
jgi:hypothetical protein